jgi:hypothetical protein
VLDVVPDDGDDVIEDYWHNSLQVLLFSDEGSLKRSPLSLSLIFRRHSSRSRQDLAEDAEDAEKGQELK